MENFYRQIWFRVPSHWVSVVLSAPPSVTVEVVDVVVVVVVVVAQAAEVWLVVAVVDVVVVVAVVGPVDVLNSEPRTAVVRLVKSQRSILYTAFRPEL